MRLAPRHKTKSKVKKPEVRKPTVKIRRKQEVTDEVKSNGGVSVSAPTKPPVVSKEEDMFVPSKPTMRTKKVQEVKEPIPISKPERANKKSQSEISNRLSGLAKLISSVAKKHGEGSLIQMNSAAIKPVNAISSGSIGLDYALGIGGYPRGRIVELYGPAASGKSTLTLHAIAECQKKGGIAAFIDAEHALDLKYARQLGVNTEELLFSQPDYGEQALDIVDEIIKANVVDLIVVDSVAALTPKAELEGDMEKNHVGLQARMMSQGLRKLTAIASKTDSCLIFINQIREKVGVTWGSNETTPGGRSLKFYCSIRVDIRRMSSIKKGDVVTGNRVKVKITKNKLAPPHQECQFDIIFGQGINSDGDLVDIATGYGLIEKSGSWFSYKGIQLGQGRDGAVKALNEDSAMKKEIETEIRKGLFGTK